MAYRAAVIGLGRMGSTFDDEMKPGSTVFIPYCHGPTYVASPLTELSAGADPHDEQRGIFGERWGLSSDHLYSDYKEMLANEKLDIVSVCTTAKIRAGIVEDAARAGVKAIWAEKPIAISLEEADAMVNVCRENGVTLAVNCSRRWHPFYSQARRLIDEGELGQILQVTGYCRCGLSHNGSHLIDAVRFLAVGDVEWVFGEMESDEAAAGDKDLMGNGYLAFDNGVRSYIRSTPTGAARWEIHVIGEKGMIRFKSNGQGQELVLLRGDQPAEVPFPWPVRMQGMGLTILEDIVHSIETGQPPKCSGDDGRAALEVAVALRESHRRGCVKVTLPVEDRSLAIHSLETLQGDLPARIRRQGNAPSR